MSYRVVPARRTLFKGETCDCVGSNRVPKLLLSTSSCTQSTRDRPSEILNQPEVRPCRFCCWPLSDTQPEFSNDVPPGLHYLPPLNPRSEEFVKLFRTFLTSKDERANILALAEPDAKLFIELIDRVCSFRTVSVKCLVTFVPGCEGVPSCSIRSPTPPTRIQCSEEVVWQDWAYP